jgi:hypothetical protein
MQPTTDNNVGAGEPARNRRVDHLYAMICGKIPSVASLRKQGDSAVTSVDGSNALTEWLNYIFQFLEHWQHPVWREKRMLL